MLPVLAQIAVTPQSVDYMSWFTQQLDGFTLAHSGILLPQGFLWLGGLFFIMCFKTFAMWGLFRRGDAFDVAPLVEMFVWWMVAYFVLSFYVSPIPGVGVSVHEIFSQEARFIAATIDLSSVNTLTRAVGNALLNMEKPAITNFFGALIYSWTAFEFMLIYALSFCITVAGYCALAIGAMMGPILIPFAVVPTLRFLAFGWFRFMITYALWRVVASALLNIWSNVMVQFFDRMLGTNYSIGHFMLITPVMGVLIAGFAFTLLFVYRISSDLVGGAASMGSPVAAVSSLAGAAVKAI